MTEDTPTEELNIDELTYEQKVEKLDEILTRLDNSGSSGKCVLKA